MSVHVELRARLDQWARENRGGGPQAYHSVWPSDKAIDGPCTGRETALGKASRPAKFERFIEWDEQVAETNQAVCAMWRRYGDVGADMVKALRIEHGTDLDQKSRAREARMSLSTYRLRVRDAHNFLAGVLAP